MSRPCKDIWPGNGWAVGKCETNISCTPDSSCETCGKGFIDNGSNCLDSYWVFGLVGGTGLLLIITLVIVIIVVASQRNKKGKEIDRLKEEGAAKQSVANPDDDDHESSPTEQGKAPEEDRYMNQLAGAQGEEEREDNVYEDMPGPPPEQQAAKSEKEDKLQAEGRDGEQKQDGQKEEGTKEEEEGEGDCVYSDVVTEVAYTNQGFQGDIPTDFEANLAHIDTEKNYFPWSTMKAQRQELNTLQTPTVEIREANPRQHKEADEMHSGEYTPIDD